LKHQDPFTSSHGLTFQKNGIFSHITVKSSNPAMSVYTNMAGGFSRMLFHLSGHSATCLINLNIISNVTFIPPFSSYLETIVSVKQRIIFTVTGSRLKISCVSGLSEVTLHTQLLYQNYTFVAKTVQFNTVLTSTAQHSSFTQ
jgi:hypothetical protein